MAQHETCYPKIATLQIIVAKLVFHSVSCAASRKHTKDTKARYYCCYQWSQTKNKTFMCVIHSCIPYCNISVPQKTQNHTSLKFNIVQAFKIPPYTEG